MFWTDWGSTPKIERATLAGTNRTLLIDLTSSVQNWPNAIILDYLEDRIYWIDAWIDAIDSADLDGNNRRAISSPVHPSRNMHPFDLTVYDDVLYWSDWNTDSIERLNWTTAAYLGGFGILTSDRVFGLALLHSSRQPDSAGNYNFFILKLTYVTAVQHLTNEMIASHADVLRGSSRIRGAGTRDEPLRASAWEANEMIAYKIPNEPKVYQIYETTNKVNYTVEKYLCNSVKLKPWVAFSFSLELFSTLRKNGTSTVKLHKNFEQTLSDCTLSRVMKVKTHIFANMPYNYVDVDLSTFVPKFGYYYGHPTDFTRR